MMCTILRTSKKFAKNQLLLLTSSTTHIKANRSPTKVLYSSTKVVPQHKDEDEPKEIKEYIKISKMQRKIRTKKPQRDPFVKNLFLGIFDRELLTYPAEVIEKHDWIQLNKDLIPVRNYMESADVTMKLGKIPKEHVEALAKLNLLALQAPHVLGGEDLTNTESICYNEALASQTNSIGVVNSNYSVASFLIKFGTPEQQAVYLRKLIEGQVAALCIHETDCPDIKLLQTTATSSSDDKSWVLNGTKTSVINGESSDIFIVFARTNLDIKTRSNCTAFIVDRSMAGVVTKSSVTHGLENTDISEVSFHNVKVPSENVLSSIDNGEKLLHQLLAEMRLGTAPMCITLTRNALNNLINHCKSVQIENLKYYETDAVSSKIAQVAISLYAMESVTYLTSSLMDTYENQDCEIEASIAKVFCSENTYKAATGILEFIGSTAFDKEHWANKYYRDAMGHVLFNEANDNLKLAVPLLGLQYAGAKLNEQIRMMRNPLLYPKEKLKRMFTHRRHMEDRPKLTLALYYDLHPSLKPAADALEYCVMRLQFATENLLAEYGGDIIVKHMELQRLSECIIDIYTAVAVIGRASRSYCIGLRNADMEICMAAAFSFNTRDKVRRNVLEILQGQYVTNDQNYRIIAQRVFDSGKYFAEHPLEKNY